MRHLPYKKIVSLVLILSFVVPAALASYPKKAEAQLAVAEVNSTGNLFQNIITAVKSTASSIYQYTLQYKETVLDGIAWYVAKAIIRQMTTSIVNWINSGFDGNPSFVTDPAGMFINIADQEIGKFIAGSSDLNFLCQPFSIDVRIALAFRYRPFKEKVTCTFTDIARNAQNAGNGFMQGNFSQGGWDKWISLTTEPQNNYIGASLLADEELSIRIANKQARQKMELDWGKGFLSWKKCVAYASNDSTKSNFYGPRAPGTGAGESDFIGPLQEASPSETGKGQCVREETQTPGTVIESGLENVLGSGVRQLELADEFNEIVNALFAQLVKTVITSASGLKGASGSGTFDSTSYINKMSAQQSAEETQALTNIKDNSLKGINDSITEETTFKQNKDAALAALIKAKNALTNVQVCYQQKLSAAQVPPLTISQITVAQNRIAEAGDIVTRRVNPVAEPIAKDIQDSANALLRLGALKAAIQSAKTINEAQTPTGEYNTLVRERALLHETPAVVQSGIDKDKIISDMATLESQTSVKMQQCQIFPAGAF